MSFTVTRPCLFVEDWSLGFGSIFIRTWSFLSAAGRRETFLRPSQPVQPIHLRSVGNLGLKI